MVKYVVSHERDNCIGCGACVGLCPKFWDMDNDGKSKLKGSKDNQLEIKEADLACNKEAAESCPVNIIHITADGKKVI